MQTFLPYPDFAESAAVLDDSRLGKQRVETLQILRALVIPDYGWQRHPAVRMWMGHVPALVRYGLAMADEWLDRGRPDITRDQILEFASGNSSGTVDGDGTDHGGGTGDRVWGSLQHGRMPPWLGDPAFHAAHRSNLIRKRQDFYRTRFPAVPENLPYVWPEPAQVLHPHEPGEPRLWVWRGGLESASGAAGDPAMDYLLMPRRRSSTRPSPKWRRQVAAFTDVVQAGDQVAVADTAGTCFRIGLIGPMLADGGGQGGAADGGGQGGAADDEGRLLRSIEFTGWLERSDFVRPALLQDPRTLFAIPVD